MNSSTLSEMSEFIIEGLQIEYIHKHESLLPIKDNFSALQKIAAEPLNLTMFNETFLKRPSEQMKLAQLPFYATQSLIICLKYFENLHKAVQLAEDVFSSVSSLSYKTSSSSSILSDTFLNQTILQVQYDEKFLKILRSAIEPVHNFIGGLSKFDNRLKELGQFWLEKINDIDRFLKLHDKFFPGLDLTF
ncbi:hypothetical protein L5515_015344 [Caenorhabditis briggsae]|uniref:Uncharacterized protein n=1 Tax=Caenorhabditis briggsae TaxID=6238 RepID=A0AAE9EFN1_CAEBR|nr:hypothetical protein L5515_015344 [Caenorhabditis briggsae]